MNAFAELGLEPALQVDSEVLEQAYREQSKMKHPDVGGNPEDFQQLAKAREILASDVQRLKHLAVLAGANEDEISRGSLSSEVAEFFSPVAGTLETARALARELGVVQTALQKALLQKKVMKVQQEIGERQAGLEEMSEGFLRRVTGVDDQAGLSQAVRDLSFVNRWRGELRKAFAELWV